MLREKSARKYGALRINPLLQTSRMRLEGTNYFVWSRSHILLDQANGLQEYLIGKHKLATTGSIIKL